MPDTKNILVTGYPGVGKTTLIRKVAARLEHFHLVGFFTEEIRRGGVRVGFELIDFSGRRQVLSHIDIDSRSRVGKYGVDIPAFERYLATLDLIDEPHGIVVIDEIGKMECLSPKFTALIRTALDSRRPVLATIAMKGEGLIAEVKRRPDVTINELTPANCDLLVDQLATQIVARMRS